MTSTENRVQDILKQAIIMESRAKALYSKVAEQTPSEGVKKIFGIMAKEEQMHIDFLRKQYSNFQEKQKFEILDKGSAKASPQVSELILTESVKNEISGAGFEAAAISAAIDMENKAIEAYMSRAKEASDPNEKAFYEWLANWEKDHHKLLISLNRELTEKIWYDNQFWPF